MSRFFLLLAAILIATGASRALRAQSAQDSVWVELSRVCRAVPQPSEEQRRAFRAAEICFATPQMYAEPVDGRSFLFDEGGKFLARVDYPGAEDCIVYCAPDPVVIRLADPVEDPTRMGLETQLYVVPADTIATSLARSGASDPANRGCIKSYVFITKGSDYYSYLDYARNGQHNIRKNVFYVTGTTKEGLLAHNHYNYGNFLWGASAHQLRIPLFMTIIGANVQNFFCSPSGHGHLDSKDDQLSIRAGYHWSQLEM